jgi:hypothetical protein
MRRSIAALLGSLVILIGQSARATKCYVHNNFEALCQFNTLERSHRTLFSPDLARADAGDDRSSEAAPHFPQPVQSKNKLARGGPLHLYRSSAGKIEATQPCTTEEKLLGHGRT